MLDRCAASRGGYPHRSQEAFIADHQYYSKLRAFFPGQTPAGGRKSPAGIRKQLEVHTENACESIQRLSVQPSGLRNLLANGLIDGGLRSLHLYDAMNSGPETESGGCGGQSARPI